MGIGNRGLGKGKGMEGREVEEGWGGYILVVKGGGVLSRRIVC